MDPIYSIDKQTLLSNRKTGKQIEENKRNLENEVAALEMLRFMTAHRKKLVNSLHEKTVEATNSNIKIKYNEIEKATILLNGGLKEKDIRKIVSAYEIYVKNNQNDSNDLEFIQGMDISYGELVNLSFFRDEVEPLFQIPVTEDLLILQKFENENKYEKIIASKLVISRGKVYLKDINIKGFNIKDDKYLYQIKSSYGVIEKNRLLFASISSDIKEKNILSGVKIFSNGSSKKIDSVDFIVPLTLLPYLSKKVKWKNNFDINILLNLINYFEPKDTRHDILKIELILRIFDYSFILLVNLWLWFSFFRHSKPYKTKPYWLIIFAPFVLFGVYLFYQLFIYYIRLIFGLIIFIIGFKLLIIVISTSVLIILILSIALLITKQSKSIKNN